MEGYNFGINNESRSSEACSDNIFGFNDLSMTPEDKKHAVPQFYAEDTNANLGARAAPQFFVEEMDADSEHRSNVKIQHQSAATDSGMAFDDDEPNPFSLKLNKP